MLGLLLTVCLTLYVLRLKEKITKLQEDVKYLTLDLENIDLVKAARKVDTTINYNKVGTWKK